MLTYFQQLLSKRIVKATHSLNSENSDGDFIVNSKNCHNAFDVVDSEDVTDAILATKSKDCFNVSFLGDKTELACNSISTYNCHSVMASYFTIDSNNVEYSEYSFNSSNLFGCIGLKHKQYCILNKQYSPEDYQSLRGKIMTHMRSSGEWGRFLPQQMSCFGYNETTANIYYQLTKDQALLQGFKWRSETPAPTTGQVPTVSPPDNIADTPDTVINETLTCETCDKPYRIISQELRHYKKMTVPIPRQCHNCRFRWRQTLRNPRKLFTRQCAKCKTDMQTTYAPDRPEIVYCEKCYLKTIY